MKNVIARRSGRVLSFALFAAAAVALAAPVSAIDRFDDQGNLDSILIPRTSDITPAAAPAPPPPAPSAGCEDGELQLMATASHSGGGAGTYGAQNGADGFYEEDCSGTAITFTWFSGSSSSSGVFYMLDWPAPVEICEIFVDTKAQPSSCGANTNRVLASADIQTWDGSTWVTQGSVTNQVDDWSFQMPECVTTTRLRLFNIRTNSSLGFQNSNAVLHELKVYPCGAGGPDPEPGDCDLTPVLVALDAIEAKLDANLDVSVSSRASQASVDALEVKLDALQMTVDDLFAGQCEVIRLLHTPQGIRTSSTANCGDFSWNDDGAGE